MKILHFSDAHILNLKHYDKFVESFENFFEMARKDAPDMIVFTGDLFHTKLTVTGESIKLAKLLFQGLAKIAPVHLILGNHDALVKNSKRISAVIPVVGELEGVTLYTKSDFYDVEDTNITFGVYSVLEKNELNDKSFQEDRINIALFHGTVIGSVSEVGYKFTSGVKIEEFSGFDYCFFALGAYKRGR